MPRSSPVVTAFNGGEVTNLLRARVADVSQLRNACKQVEHYIPRPHGPAEKKPGTYFITMAKYGQYPCDIWKFTFNRAQSYAIEAGRQYLRFLTQRAQIFIPGTDANIADGGFDSGISEWSNASGTGASISHDATGGRLVLTGNGDSNPARARISVSTSTLNQVHVLRFRLEGLIGDGATVRIGTTEGGEELVKASDKLTGCHAIGFTPTASPIHIEFSQTAPKDVYLDDIRFQSNEPLEIESVWDETQVLAVKNAHSKDVVYCAQQNHPPQKLERFGNTSWSLSNVDLHDGPFEDENADDSKQLTPSATSGYGVTVTASGFSPFSAQDVGRSLRIKIGADWGWGRIASFVSATQVTVDVKENFGGTTATAAWRLGLFCEKNGYPAAVMFAKGRLHLLGSAARPERGDGSVTADFENFRPGTEDNDGVSYTTSGNELGEILWADNSRFPLLGTPSGTHRLIGETVEAPIRPSAVDTDPQSGDGTADIAPVRAGRSLIYIDEHGRSMLEAAYSLEADAVPSVDLSLRSEHLATKRNTFCDLTYQKAPWRALWACRSDGTLISATSLREESIPFGAARHPPGGGRRAERVQAIPGDGSDDLYIVYSREKNGQSERMIEVLADPLENDQAQEEAFYVECGLSLNNAPPATLTLSAASGPGVVFTVSAAVFNGETDVGMRIKYRRLTNDAEGFPKWTRSVARITAVNSATEVVADINLDFPSVGPFTSGSWRLTVSQVSGLDHLEGETVDVLGDGGVQDQKIVQNGTITLDPPAAEVHVGENYVSRLRPLPLNPGAVEGTSQTKSQRISKLAVMVERSLGVRVGQDAGKLSTPPPIRRSLDAPPELVTEDMIVSFPGTFSSRAQPYVQHDIPMKATIVGIVPVIGVGEG